MITFSNCKINIGLDILRRRPDGYHDIATAMVPVPWGDIIEAIPSSSGETTLTVLGNAVDCPAEKNLVMRAYRAMEAEAGVPPTELVLQKIVPDGAGLGGGSSDAAFTLKLLNDLYGTGLSAERLAEMAASIGADCPFFIYSTPMLATGIGTTLQPISLDLSGYHCLIAKLPGVSVSTKQAYSGVTPHEPEKPLARRLEEPISKWQGLITNDFEQSVMALEPSIASLKQSMIDMGAEYAAMSGSGSAVYGLFGTDTMADACREQLSQACGGCITWLGKL